MDLPKKKAFYFFYNCIKFVYCTKNKLALFGIFKHYKLIFIAFKKYFISFLFKFLTSFPLITIKNTNFVYHKFFNVFNSNWKTFMSFYSNFIFNLLIDYNDIQGKIKNHRILFNTQLKKVIVNPFDSKSTKILDPLKTFLENLKNLTNYNLGLNDIRYSSSVNTVIYNTSEPMVSCGLKINEKYSFNTVYLPKENVFVYKKYNEMHKHIEHFIIRSNEHLAEINKQNHYNIAGYKEEPDFKNLIDINRLKDWDINDLKNILIEDKNGYIRIPIHILNDSSQTLISADFNIQKFEEFWDIKSDLAKDVFLYWNSYLLEYKLLENNNLFLSKSNITLRGYLLENRHTCEFNVKVIIDTVDQFYKDNENLILKLTHEELKNCLDNINTPENIVTELLFKLTNNFEKRGSDINDISEAFNFNSTVDCNLAIDNIVQNLKALTDK